MLNHCNIYLPKKAFNTIDHDILIRKLKNIGIRGIVLECQQSYLRKRQQYVEFNNEKSSRLNIICHMSLTCCIKSHCIPATLAPAHTPCLFSIDLYTVRQHLVIVHFLLLLLLSGTLFQMMSGVPHHCHHLSLV